MESIEFGLDPEEANEFPNGDRTSPRNMIPKMKTKPSRVQLSIDL